MTKPIPKPQRPQGFMTPQEAAEMALVPRSTIYGLLNKGEIEGFKWGVSWLVRFDTFAAWLVARGDRKAVRRTIRGLQTFDRETHSRLNDEQLIELIYRQYGWGRAAAPRTLRDPTGEHVERLEEETELEKTG